MKLATVNNGKLLFNVNNNKLLCVEESEPVWPFDINSAHILLKDKNYDNFYTYHSQCNDIDVVRFGAGKTLEYSFGTRTLTDAGRISEVYPDGFVPLTIDEHMIMFGTTEVSAVLKPVDSENGDETWYLDGEEVEHYSFTIQQDPYVGAYRWTDRQNKEYFFSLTDSRKVIQANGVQYPLTPGVSEGEYTFTSGGQTCRLIINNLDQVSILAGMSEIPLTRNN